MHLCVLHEIKAKTSGKKKDNMAGLGKPFSDKKTKKKMVKNVKQPAT